MGFDRKMDSKVDSKPVWEASPPPFSFTVTLLSIPRQIQHITLDVHPVERGARLGGAESALTKRSWSPVWFMPFTIARLDHSQEQRRHQLRPRRSRYQLPNASSGFEDEAAGNGVTVTIIRMLRWPRPLRELERLAELLHCLRGCGLDPKGAWPDC